MHPDNSFYGHDVVLRQYAGLDPSARLGVHVQHGWQLGTGLNDVPRLVPWIDKLVWNTRNELACRREGIDRSTAVGAPFVYLARCRRAHRRSSRSGTIFFPFHSWERWHVDAQHEELALAILDREQGPVTVCLYDREFRMPWVREVYESAGFRVVTNGPRDGNPAFLSRLFDALDGHARVASNRVTTAAFCGAHLGLDVEVYGPAFRLDRPDDPGEIFRTSDLLHAVAHGGLSGSDAQLLGDQELGADHIRSPDELRELLRLDIGAGTFRRLRFLSEHHIRRAWVNRPWG